MVSRKDGSEIEKRTSKESRAQGGRRKRGRYVPQLIIVKE